MLVSAVLDPSAFDKECFDELYRIYAEEFLLGIERNGVLIVDSDNRLRDALVRAVQSLDPKYSQRLQILVYEILLNNRSKRIVRCSVAENARRTDFFGLTSHLQTLTEADALVTNQPLLEGGNEVVLLSKYRDSGIERERRRYDDGMVPIDVLSKSKVDDIIVRSVRFAKWLRFYDGYIGTGNNISHFRNGIAYILSLWKDKGFFVPEEGVGSVEIYTCPAERIWDDEDDHVKESKLKRNRDNYKKIYQNLILPLRKIFPWPVKLFVKSDPDGIFHARYLETQQAIIRIDRGFDLFNQNGGFRRNFFTLNMAESSHLRDCRKLPNVDIGDVS